MVNIRLALWLMLLSLFLSQHVIYAGGSLDVQVSVLDEPVS